MSDFLQATNQDPTTSYMGKVRKAVDANHPAEIAYREGREKKKAHDAAAVEYERREYVDDDGATYVIEDREDGPYVIASQKGDEPIRNFGGNGLRIDELPESAIDKDIMDRVGEAAIGTLEVAEGGARGLGLGLTKFVTNVARTAIDNPLGEMALGEENVQAFEDFSTEFLKNAEDAARKSGIVDEDGNLLQEWGGGKEFGKGGQIAVGVGDVAGQYIAPAGALYKGFRAMGAAPLLASLLADGAVGFAGVAPESENIFNMIPEDSEAFGILNDVIGTDPEDPEFENRLKNAGEAMLLLGIGEGVVKSVVGGIRSGKQAIKSMDLPASVNKAIDRNVDKAIKGAKRMIKDERGSIDLRNSKTKIQDLQNQLVKKHNLETLFLSEKSNGSIEISMIEVPKEMRKQGVGSSAMQDLIDYADKNQKRLELTPGLEDANKGTTSKQRLKKFYKRFGFVENKGRNKDFSTMSGMIRDPKAAAGVGAGAAVMAPADANASLGDPDQSIDTYLSTLRQVESGNDPLARNPKSSAKGLYQFIDETGKQFGLDKIPFGTPEYTEAEHQAVIQFTEQNRSGLQEALGREPTQGELYLAHQQGLNGALKLLQNPTKNAVDILGREQVRLNGGHAGMNAQQFARMWTKKFDGSIADAEGIKVAGLGKQGFELLIESMKKGPSNETVAKAGKMLAEDGGKIVPDETALKIREAIESGGTAQGIDFNLSRMETPDQLNMMIDEISQVYKEPIDKAKRGVQSFDDTQAKADLARMTGFDVDAVLSRQEGELWPAEKIKAARDMFVSELGKTEELARSIKSGQNTSENMIAFRRQLAVVSAMQSNIKGVQTETARALGQYRMTAKTPMEAQVNLAEMIQKSGGADLNENFVDAYLNVIENGGPEAAATFARNAEQVTGMDMLFEAWINSLLGSPATHAVNMLGNSGTIAVGTVERYAAATYGTIERGVGKALGKDVGGITFSEANAMAQGQAMSVNDAMVAFLKALRDGEGTDLFGKIDYHTDAITTQNINELPLSKTITSKLMQGDELIQSNSQLAHMIDFMGEYYYRLPGRMLMAEDEFFKTVNYRGELHAQAAREAAEQGLDGEAAKQRIIEIMADPQLNAPEIHQRALEFSREQTFTTPAGEVASRLSNFLNNAKVGDFPAGRVVVPFFNVINNITKYVGGRVPGLGLINPNSKTYKDFFSKDPAKRQLVMGKWATGSSLLGFGAWSSMNGICTGRISDNWKMVSQIEQGQGKKRYACHLPGTDRMMNYNRLEPAGMLMAIAADTATALAYVDDDEERQNLVLAATAAVVPYMEDKSFFEGISSFFEAFNPQYGGDEQRSKALGRYFSDKLASAPGAVLGPLAPGTPLSRNATKNLFMDNAKKVAEANKWTIEKDEYGDDILVANSETYQIFNRALKKIYAATPGLSATLPNDVNVWGEEIIYEGGLGPDIVTPIYTNTPKYDVKDLKGKNFPPQIEAGRFRDMRVGTDLTVEQHRKFIDVVGIDGELERLNMPLSKPRGDISARVNGKVVGLPVDLNQEDRIALIKIMNEIKVPNDADPDRKRMNLKETLNWMISQPEYAKLPDDRDATGAKGDMIRKVYNEYKGASIELFFANHPKGQAYFKRSVEMKQKAQNTGVQ